MSRKILISYGFGAGWVSWARGTKEQKRFMLEYKPFIEALENDLPLDEAQFLRDFSEKFPDAEEPYMGGVHQLEVEEILDHEAVLVKDYDGNESFSTRSEEDYDWL
jgi:hypothetical protein